MSMPAFDLRAATAAIDHGPAVATVSFQIGKHAFTLEKVETIWHRADRPDAVFRVILDGVPVFDEYGFGRAFFRPLVGVHRQILGIRVFAGRKPAWLPKNVTLKAANAAFDAAALSIS